MKSGLEGRNNEPPKLEELWKDVVSMKSGLEGRNKEVGAELERVDIEVSMKSGLEGRNNSSQSSGSKRKGSLNEVRPRRPEQGAWAAPCTPARVFVSMKSGLEGRNKRSHAALLRGQPRTSQ